MICTDHKPLLSLFNEMKAVPQMASPRIQHWAVTLRAYEYEIVYKPGKHHSNADALSRLPLPQPSTEGEHEDRVLMIEDITLVWASELSKWTRKDPVLSRVWQFVQHGWPPQHSDPVFQPYAARQTVECAGWLCVVGVKGGGPSARAWSFAASTASWSPRHHQDESIGTQLFLVAKVRHGHRSAGERM